MKDLLIIKTASKGEQSTVNKQWGKIDHVTVSIVSLLSLSCAEIKLTEVLTHRLSLQHRLRYRNLKLLKLSASQWACFCRAMVAGFQNKAAVFLLQSF